MEPGRAAVASNSRAPTTALVIGIVGTVCCQLAAPVAWILGAKELKAIRQGRSSPDGRGFALAGMILGIVGTGMLLVSLLIVPAIVIPNFVSAQQRAKQYRTVSDLRALGAALEAYCASRPELTSCYPEASSVEELSALLSPAYLSRPITVDGWQRPLRYDCWADAGFPGCQHAALRSAGRDGRFEFEDLAAYPSAEADGDVDRDIVWVDGSFRRLPFPPSER